MSDASRRPFACRGWRTRDRLGIRAGRAVSTPSSPGVGLARRQVPNQPIAVTQVTPSTLPPNRLRSWYHAGSFQAASPRGPTMNRSAILFVAAAIAWTGQLSAQAEDTPSQTFVVHFDQSLGPVKPCIGFLGGLRDSLSDDLIQPLRPSLWRIGHQFRGRIAGDLPAAVGACRKARRHVQAGDERPDRQSPEELGQVRGGRAEVGREGAVARSHRHLGTGERAGHQPQADREVLRTLQRRTAQRTQISRTSAKSGPCHGTDFVALDGSLESPNPWPVPPAVWRSCRPTA